MNEISINGMAAAQAVAETIEGLAPQALLVDRDLNASREVFAGRAYTEIQLVGDRARTARVTIERPEPELWDDSRVRPATVTWSSSDSDGGIEDARATARLLAFAAEVAETLNRWANAGQLPRLSGDEVAS